MTSSAPSTSQRIGTGHTLAGRLTILAWGVLCYALFFACFLYAIAFIGNLSLVAKTIDSGAEGPLGPALAIDLGLLLLFAVQHSGMARPRFKRAITRLVPESAERATYVLLSSAVLALLFVLWRPIGGVVWNVANPIAANPLFALYVAGWGMLLYSTALIDHLDLFGLRQVWAAFRGRPFTPHPFATPGLYRYVRHPPYVSWAIIFWATPEMSVGHLVFSLAATGYMILAVFAEEPDLVDRFGDAYRRYQESTPKFVPRLSRTRHVRNSAIPPR